MWKFYFYDSKIYKPWNFDDLATVIYVANVHCELWTSVCWAIKGQCSCFFYLAFAPTVSQNQLFRSDAPNLHFSLEVFKSRNIFHVQFIIHWITVSQHPFHVKVLSIVPKVVGKCVSDFFTLNPAVLFFIWRAIRQNNYQEINQRYTPQNCRPHLYFACYVSCSIQ